MDTRPTTHPTLHELAAFALGKLPDSQATLVAQHLEDCSLCAQTVHQTPADSFLGLLGQARSQTGSNSSLPAGRPLGQLSLQPSLGPDLPPELASHPKFQVRRRLGQGGMGTVYHARHKIMDRDVALKVINPALLEHPSALPRFFAEVKAAAKLDHPNIVRAYDAEAAGSLHLFVMEHVEGQSLAQVVERQGPLTVADACSSAYQAALGLQHAFEMGMVHRDIKPANLMLTPKGKVKVLDFGLARLASEQVRETGLTQANSFMGTPEYVSPEQAYDAHRADIRADLYSLGCTLFCLLTGHPPFQGGTALEVVFAHVEKEAPDIRTLRPDVPAPLAAMIARLLRKDPAQRYQQPVEVAEALAPFCRSGGASLHDAPSPTSPSPADHPVPGNRPVRARRWAAIGVSLLAVGLAVAVIHVAFRVKTPEGTIVLENVPEDADVEVDGKQVTVARAGDEVTVSVTRGGTYPLKVVRKNGDTLLSRDVEVQVGSKPFRVRLEPLPDRRDGPRPPAGTAPPITTLTGKLPAPPADRVAELQQVAREGIRAELSSGQPSDLTRAAKSFLTRADALERPDERFALLDLARDLAAQAGDFPLALDTCARLDRAFLIDPLAVKVRTLQRLARAELPPGVAMQCGDALLAAGFEGLGADNYGLCRDAARADAELLARVRSKAPAHPSRPPDRPFVYQIRFLEEELGRAEAAYARLSAAAKKADAVTNDPDTNTARGLFLCLVKNDWLRGTDFLRVGTEPWRTLAEREAKRRAAAADRAALGDLWWQAADGLPPADAVGARRRARYWYLGALALMKPAERAEGAVRLQPRIDQVPRTPITLRVRMTGLNGYHWLKISSDGVRTSDRGDRKITEDIQVNHLRWKDHVAGHRNAGATRLLPDGVDFSTTRLVSVVGSRWGAANVTATPESIDLAFWHAPFNEKSNFDLILTVESAGYNLPSRFAQQWDVAYYNWPERTPPTGEKARDALFAGEPADRMKMDTINFIADVSPTSDYRPGAPPSKKIGANRFALVATSVRQLPSGRYQVRTYADNGVRVHIDGSVALDNWPAKGEWQAASGELRLPAGAHPIRVEYYHNTGIALLQFDLVRLGD
jgi:hypothetical protein